MKCQIREGIRRILYSDTTYRWPLIVETRNYKEPKRKILEDDILFTSEAIKSILPLEFRFKRPAFYISM